ncbi:MAG: NAD(P)-binding protein, partial [Acidobacteriota bacterium]
MRSKSKGPEDFDAVVIGSGFGGLGAALRLVELGARVAVCETFNYPGGCASTFSHKGYRFDAGATLLAGLGEGQMFSRWLERHGQSVEVEALDPVVTLKSPEFELAVPNDRARFREALLSVPGVPQDGRVDRFLALQKRTADVLWPVLDDPDLLPPLGVRQMLRHLPRVPAYLPLLRWVGRPLSAVLEHFELDQCRPLRQWLDAVCQITVQCSAAEAEAPVTLATLDYFFRGAGHVQGGVGALAWALVRAIENGGGDVRFIEPVKSLRREADGVWQAKTRRGTLRAPMVFANLLPHNLRSLLEAGDPGVAESRRARSLGGLEKQVHEGWGAAMLYRVLRAPEGESPKAHHLEIVQEPDSSFLEGRHLFASLSSA